jgi:hypothetical protein
MIKAAIGEEGEQESRVCTGAQVQDCGHVQERKFKTVVMYRRASSRLWSCTGGQVQDCGHVQESKFKTVVMYWSASSRLWPSRNPCTLHFVVETSAEMSGWFTLQFFNSIV